MTSLKTSGVWRHFNKISNIEAKCTHCIKNILCKGGSTSGLKRHLLNSHSIDINTELPPAKKQCIQPTLFTCQENKLEYDLLLILFFRKYME